VLRDLLHRLPGGPAVNIYLVDGGCSEIFGIASEGVCHRHFLY
jgi:hypothetical protein